MIVDNVFTLKKNIKCKRFRNINSSGCDKPLNMKKKKKTINLDQKVQNNKKAKQKPK